MNESNVDSELEKAACLLCGSSDLYSIYKNNSIETPINIVACPNDGLVFLSPRWKRESYSIYYKSQYDLNYRPHVFNAETNSRDDKNIELIYARTNGYFQDINSILDIGAGMGSGLQFLSDKCSKKVRISAIESSLQCRKNLVDNIGADLIGDDVDDDWHVSKEKCYDVIVMRHVTFLGVGLQSEHQEQLGV